MSIRGVYLVVGHIAPVRQRRDAHPASPRLCLESSPLPHRQQTTAAEETEMAAPAPPPSSSPSPLPPTKSPPPRWEPSLDSIPDDIAFGVAAFLGAGDLCSLGSCSRFWRRLCSTDCLWAALSARRWPFLENPPPRSPGGEGASSDSSSSDRAPSFPFWPPAQVSRLFEFCFPDLVSSVELLDASVDAGWEKLGLFLLKNGRCFVLREKSRLGFFLWEIRCDGLGAIDHG